MLNEILQGQTSLEEPKQGDPYRRQEPVTLAPCARCQQPFPAGHGNVAMCPACIEAEDAAIHRAVIADAARSKRNNLVFGLLLLALGVGVALWTGSNGSWMIAVGPIVVGAAGIMRALVS